jgi:hypothetical protein
MSNQSFNVGEIVILVKAFDPTDWDYGAEPYFDTECKILALCVSLCIHGPRHRIELFDGRTCQVTGHFLRKRRPPEQKSAFTYQEIIDMCNDKTITDPLEETVKRTFVDGMWSAR